MKLDDLSFLRNIQNEMPIFESNKATLPHSFSQRFPKHIPDESAKIQNKFLNDNLGKIEDAQKSNLLSKNFISWFLRQNYRHLEHGILNHDGFFNGIKNKLLYGHLDNILGCGLILGNMNTGAYRHVGCIVGADITMGDTSNHSAVGTTIIHFCSPTSGSTGTIGECYNRIAQNYFNSTGNSKLACYDNGSTNPNALIGGETTSQALDSTFTWRNVTEFELTTTKIWLAFQCDNASNDVYYNSAGIGLRRQQTHTYANAFPNPATPSNNDGVVMNLKIGHT